MDDLGPAREVLRQHLTRGWVRGQLQAGNSVSVLPRRILSKRH